MALQVSGTKRAKGRKNTEANMARNPNIHLQVANWDKAPPRRGPRDCPMKAPKPLQLAAVQDKSPTNQPSVPAKVYPMAAPLSEFVVISAMTAFARAPVAELPPLGSHRSTRRAM
jgi:hypothetical protein